MQELKEFLTQEQIKQILEDGGRFISRVRFPVECNLKRFCDVCLIHLRPGQEIYVLVYFLPLFHDKYIKAQMEQKWYVREMLCETCGELMSKDSVVCDKIIPSLQKYFEKLLKRYEHICWQD
ncbi:hypothetical protein [Thermodesulfovibrio sp. TK110]